MSKITRADILKKTAKAKVHKSFRAAIADITQELEDQHFAMTKKVKAATVKHLREARR